MKMRRDKVLLLIGILAGIGVAAGAYVIRLGWVASVGVVIVAVLLARVVVYVHFERFLAFRTFEESRSERPYMECQA